MNIYEKFCYSIVFSSSFKKKNKFTKRSITIEKINMLSGSLIY